jgi:hypothetical protein
MPQWRPDAFLPAIAHLPAANAPVRYLERREIRVVDTVCGRLAQVDVIAGEDSARCPDCAAWTGTSSGLLKSSMLYDERALISNEGRQINAVNEPGLYSLPPLRALRLCAAREFGRVPPVPGAVVRAGCLLAEHDRSVAPGT